MASKKAKPPCKGLFELVHELQDAAHQVVMEASSIYGAVTAHCDLMDAVRPGMGDALREVASKHYEALMEARKKLYRC